MHAATNYIYIIIAVLYIIYSIIKAAKKAAQQKPVQKKSEPAPVVKPPASSPLPNPGDDMKKMLEEILGKTPEVKIPDKHPDTYREPKPHPIPVRTKPAKISHQAIKKEKAAVSHMPAKSVPKTEPHTFLPSEHISSKPVFQEPVLEEEVSLDFDLRQAIIYSEILKRPQY